jgi:nickel/cobalt exporter
MGRSSRRSPLRHVARLAARGAGVTAAILVLLLAPATASAHPLGNFTINHYAGLTIGRTAIAIDLVIDKAEIPAFQDRQAADQDADGEVSDEEAATWAQSSCETILGQLHLTVGGAAVTPSLLDDTIAFLPGVGGLSTLRLECQMNAMPSAAIDAATRITFADTSFAERIGWREVVATGAGTLLDTHGLPATSPSKRLTAYPADMIGKPLDIRSATVDARPDPAATSNSPAGAAASAAPVAVSAAGAVPGGVASELPDVISSALSGPLSPLVWLGALGAAFIVGAFHAITPGHGKTVMAAYLVGTKGSPAHAVGLGLSVAVSHTLGILALAVVVIAAEGALPPDVIARTTPVIAAGSIVVIGGLMLLSQIRQRRAGRRAAIGSDHVHEHGTEHGHVAAHEHVTSRAHGQEAEHDHDGQSAHGHDHPHPSHANAPTADHSHGGIAHSHVPAGGATLTWRGLFALGLTGGLIPSTSALVILLGSIVAGRTVLGLVLVVVFGLGMASVMSAVGLAMVFARGRLDRVSGATRLGRVATAVPLLAAVAVTGIGLVLTWSAVAGQPVF